jgi:2-dehydropantoate 2-reductase
VLVAVKAHALAPLAPRLAAWAGRGAAVVTLQNGLPHWFFEGVAGVLHGKHLRSVDAEGALAAALPAAAIVAAVVNVGARIPAPGVVEQIGDRSFILGEAGGGASDRAAALVEAFAGAGLEATVDDDIRLPIWRKLAANAALNPVSALCRAGLAVMVDDPQVAALIAVVVDEMLAIGRASGLDVDLPRAAFLEKARAYGDQRTSMLQDLDAGRPLEIGPILDAPLEVAAVLGVAVPTARHLAALVHLLDATAAQRGVRPAASEPSLM